MVVEGERRESWIDTIIIIVGFFIATLIVMLMEQNEWIRIVEPTCGYVRVNPAVSYGVFLGFVIVIAVPIIILIKQARREK